MNKVVRYGKTSLLCVILAVSAWLFLAPTEDDLTAPRSPAQERKEVSQDAEYIIRMSPGPFYMPGAIPSGIGSPLKGFTIVTRAFEERFPDTRIVLDNVPTRREYLVTQLSSGRAPDIVMVNVEDVWVDSQKGWYLPLDEYLDAPNPFVREKSDPAAPGYNHWWDMFRYQAISRGKSGPDGRYYCLSYDMVETGIYYNKSIFLQLGVQAPDTWEKLIETMQTIRAAGYVPLALSIVDLSDWAVDLFIDQLYDQLLPGIDLAKDPVREPYLQGYLDDDELCFLHGQGFFAGQDPRYVEVWRLLHDLRRFCSKNIGAAGIENSRDFVNQKAAMLWTSSNFTHRLVSDRQLEFEWGVFYLPAFTRANTRFAADPPRPMCVIGGSADQFEVTNSAYNDTGDPATSEKLKRVIAFLQFICVPEYYEQIVNEYTCFLSNIVGVPSRPELKPFEQILKRQYTTTKLSFTFDLRFNEIMQRMLALYLDDGVSLKEFLVWQDANFDAAVRNLLSRKPIDMARLNESWEALAPARAQFRELPRAD